MENSKPKILVVDDDQPTRDVNAELISRMLPESVIDKGANGTELLQKARETRYDLIITDNNMPYKKGLDALLELRTEGKLEKAILITGILYEQDREKMSLSGIPFLEKPIDITQLRSAIKTAIPIYFEHPEQKTLV